MQHMPTHAQARRPGALALAATALALAACSRSEPPAAPTAAASAPVTVAVAPTTSPPPANPAVQSRTIVAQDDTARRAERRHERVEPLPPRADRDDAAAIEARHEREQQRVAAAACANCGVVESFDTVKVQGQTNGTGAVAGGVGGAVVGNRIAGRNDKTLGGVIGAVGGGLIGNAIEKHERTTQAYDVHVRMNDGSLRTVRQSTAPALGMKVLVEADGLHARS